MLIQSLHKLVRFRVERLGIESKRMEIPGCSLHYYEYRHPNPRGAVVLVHGLGTSSSTWFHLYSSLIREHTVVALDLPGFGFSTISTNRKFLSVAEHTAVLDTFTAKMALFSFTLIGHSLGGWIAAKYASAHPKQVARLVLINTAGVHVEGVENLLRAFDIKTTGDMRRLADTMWHKYPWYFKPLLPAFRDELVRREVPEFVRSIRSDDFFDGGLRRLSMPVHLIWGTEDGLISPETIGALQKDVPHLTVDYIQNCGHVPQLENPQRVEEILKSVFESKPL
ncbi:MAG: alpha/beta hydrolase [Ignavibacteriae bacterium]|nr:alpha/beta hydrolase [Ignavibacteriota bacterium]